jgi:endonuclease YncB( thermonuclease family)
MALNLQSLNLQARSSATGSRDDRLVIGLLIAIAALLGWNTQSWLARPQTSPVAGQPVSVDEVARDTSTRLSADFAVCGQGRRVTCVVDGDTIWLRGEKIRIADIDTPEVSAPKCAQELQRGRLATRRLTGLLNAGPFQLEPADRAQDRYGRSLYRLTRNGQSLGAPLVAEGLAVWYGKGRPDWC